MVTQIIEVYKIDDPELALLPDSELRKIDREETVLCLLCRDLKPIKITAVDRQIFFYFKREETESIMQKLLSNEPLMVDFHLVSKAMDLWKNALIMMKVKRSEMM